MYNRIIIDKEPFKLTCREVEGFPWVRLDAKNFVWEEVFHEGNYLTASYTCMGRGLSRERLKQRFTNDRVDMDHRRAFEVEIDGQLLRDYFVWEDDTIVKHDNGNEELIITFKYELIPLKVKLHTLIDGTSFLTRWLEVENHDTRPHAVSAIFPFTGIVATPRWESAHNIPADRFAKYSLGFYRSNYIVGEGEFAFEELHQGTRAFINNKANYNPRMFILRNDNSAENFIVDMECTAHAHVEFNYWTDNELLTRSNTPTMPVIQIRMGIARRSTFRFIAPGETVKSPVVHFAGIYGDLDACVNAHYEHLRASVLPEHPADKCNLVELNHAGYSFCEHMTKQYLINEVDLAVSVGAGIFLVDAGWFGNFPENWGWSMGEWTECKLLDNSLSEVFDYARSFGLKCGMWIAIEEVGKESTVKKEHPEWVLKQGHKVLTNLDLTNKDVEDYLFKTLEDIISRYKLDLFRIDGGYNQIADHVVYGYIENKSWKYYEGLYRLIARIRDRFPGILLENCSGGGGRVDLGMLRL
ncbi:MAG TPA: alpha-galactosidase, partial [Clostridia bacterium]|nr:alpha-galactosidase [Clostridia bacterium]